MRIGTPGFVAARLMEAREARGLTQTILAERTGIKSQSISHYEQGRQSPSPDGLSLIAAALELPERFFLRPPAPPRQGPVFAAAWPTSRTVRLKAERRLEWLKQIAAYLSLYVDLPAFRVPPALPCPDDDAAIEDAASATRSALGLSSGPADDLIPVLEQAGCIVARLALDEELGGACSHWEDQVPCLLLSASETRAGHVQYKVAQQLGHFVLHRNAHAASFDDAAAHREREARAARFARAFLLPARTFAADVWAPSIHAVLSVKKDWRCPIAVVLRRCGELGVLTEDQIRRAEAIVTKRGWKTLEPCETAAIAGPELLSQSVQLLLREGLKDRHAILTDLALSAADVEDLCGLAPGLLTNPAPHHHPHPAVKLRSADQNFAGSIRQTL